MLPPTRYDPIFQRSEFDYQVGLYGFVLSYRGYAIGGEGPVTLAGVPPSEFEHLARTQIDQFMEGELADYERQINRMKRFKVEG